VDCIISLVLIKSNGVVTKLVIPPGKQLKKRTLKSVEKKEKRRKTGNGKYHKTEK
jgi:hypothetical protein